MKARTRKAMTSITQCFFMFLILRLVEELLIIPKYFNSSGLIACVGGLVILLVYIRFIDKPLEKIGMIFSEHKVRKGLIIAVILNLVAAVIVYTVEYFLISAAHGNTVISVFYKSEQHAYSAAGSRMFLMWFVIGILVNLIHACFYEMAFRGLLITLGSRLMRFWKINMIQAVMYTFWFLIPVLRVILYYSAETSAKQILTLFLVMLVYQMLISVKLGLLRYSTGSIWVCIFDHFAFGSILDMIHVQHTAADMTVQLDGNFYLRILCYQGISLLMVFAYYLYRKSKIRKQAIIRHASHHTSHHSSHHSAHNSEDRRKMKHIR